MNATKTVESPKDPPAPRPKERTKRDATVDNARFGPWWGGFDGVAVLTVIVSYFVVLICTFFPLSWLLKLAALIPLPPALGLVVGLAFLVIEVTWAIRLGWHFCETCVGVVSSLRDVGLDDSPGVTLTREKYASLLAVIEDVCKEMKMPPIDEVRVTHRPECCAIELRQFAVTTQRRLILMIGLPNLAVMSVGELKVLIAHELAHIRRGDTRLEAFACRFLDTLLSAKSALPRYLRAIDPIWWLGGLYFAMVSRLMAIVQRSQELRADDTSASIYGGDLAAHTLLKDWMIGNEFHVLATTVRQIKHFGLTEDSRNVFIQFAEFWHDFSVEGDEYLEQRLSEEEPTRLSDAHPPVAQRVAVMRSHPPCTKWEHEPARELLGDFRDIAGELERYLLEDEIA